MSIKPKKKTCLADVIDLENDSVDFISHRIARIDSKATAIASKFTDESLNQLIEFLSEDFKFEVPCVVIPHSSSVHKADNFWERFSSFLTQNSYKVSDVSQFFAFGHSNGNQLMHYLRKSTSNAESNEKRQAILIRELNSNNVKLFETLIRAFVNQDRIDNLSIFVGVTSSLEIFEQVSSDVLNFLAIKPLDVPSARKQVSELFKEIFFNQDACEPNWKLGSKTIDFLASRFFDADLSVDSFVKAIKLCVIEDGLSMNDSLEVDYDFNSPDGISDQHKRIKIFIDILMELANDDANANYMKNVTSLCIYEQLVSSNVYKSTSWQQLNEFITYSENEKLLDCMKMYREKCSELNLSAEVEKLDNIIQIASGAVSEDMETDPLTDKTNVPTVPRPGKFRLHHLKAEVQSGRYEKDKLKEQRPRNRFLAFMEEFLSSLKNGLSSSEDRVFTKDETLISYFEKSHRLLISKALQEPDLYLKCKCCEKAGGAQESLPDSSLVYYLYSEIGGMYLNMFDFLASFLYILTSEQKSSRQKKKQKSDLIDESMYVRFLQALSNMQYVGYLKVTKRRKSEHVVKLTWNAI